MENWWTSKCNAAFPPQPAAASEEQRSQMENTDYLSCQRGSQDLRAGMLAWLQDPQLPSIQNLEHANLGDSFVYMPSGSSLPLQRGYQDFSNSQPICSAGRIVQVGSGSILNSTQGAIPLSSAGLPSDKFSWKNRQSGGSSKLVPSSVCASNSAMHDVQSSDLAKVVICQTGLDNNKPESSYTLRKEWHTNGPASRANLQNSDRIHLEANSFISNQASRVFHSASPADSWKAHTENMHASQKIPPEANSFISYHASSVCHGTNPADNGKACGANFESSAKVPVEAYSFASNQASSFMTGCPRVFCLTTSGNLLLSNTGYLGIVCTCHSFRMSAFKFCEHSGLYGVNPGDVIRTDNGETISQWCKLHLSKFGIRIPEDKSEWDWPEELSATESWMEHGVPIPRISNISSDLVSSRRDSVICKQSPSKNPIICNSAALHKPEGNSEDSDNSFLKANMTMERAMKTSKLKGNGAEDGCQLISGYVGSLPIRSPIAHPPLLEQRNEKIIGKESDFCRVEKTRDAAISNIELRLGQPYQLAQTSRNTDLSAGGPPLLGTVLNPMKSLFPQQTNASRVNHREEVEFMQCDSYPANPSDPNWSREWNWLNQGSNTFVTRNDADALRPQNSVISLLTHLKSPSKESKPSTANNYMLNASGTTMRNSVYSAPLPGKNNVNSVWVSGGNSKRQLDMLHLGSDKLIDNDKGLSFDADASHLAKCKEMEFSSSLNRLRGNGNPNFSTTHRNSSYSYQLSGVPLGTPDSKVSPDYPEVISFASRRPVDHVYFRPISSSMGSEDPTHAASNGIPVSASTSSRDLIPHFCRQEFVGVHTHLQDDKLQVHSTRQVQEISKLTLPSKNQGEGRFGFSSYMQQSHIDTSAFGKQSHKLSLVNKHDFSEASSHPSNVTCRIGTDEDSASLTGVNCCCQFSQYKQENVLNCNQVSLKHQTSVVSRCQEHSSQSEKSKDVPKSSEHERCCHKVPCGNCHGSSSHATYRNCSEINSESRVGSFPTVPKVQKGSVNSQASVILSPQIAHSHLIQNDKNVSLDHTRKLTGEVPKNKAYHNSQWRDVPSKVRGISDVKRVDRLANLFDATREDREKLGDKCIKCLKGTLKITDSLKEHESSNISSGCYARVISQPSVEFSNVESSTNGSRDHGCGSNFVDNQGSSIDKTWSSDDAPESKTSAKFLASTGFSLKKTEPPNNLHHESSSCLLDDLKLLNSLTWQRSRDQIPAEFNLRDKGKHLQKLEQGLKIGKRKRELGLKLNASCSNSSASPVRQENQKSDSTCQFISQPSKSLMMFSTSRKSGTDVIGNCITQSSSKPTLHVLSSAKKLSRRSDLHKLHNDRESEVSSVFQGEDANKRTKINYVDGFKSTSSEQVNIGHRRSKPVVCGMYGDLTDGSSTGRISKPAKLVPLSTVLSYSPRCIFPKQCKSKSSSMKTEKYKKCHAKDEDTSKRKRKKCSIGEKAILKEPTSLEKQRDIQSEKDDQKLDEINHTRLQIKPKEIRKRSIYELTGKGEHPGSKKSSVSKISNFRPVKDGKPVTTDEGDGAFCQNSAKISTQEHKCHNNCDSAPVCCVCGSSNQDEINNLLECYQCSIRVHQACYGVSKVPKGCWSCRPCRTSSKDIVCVLCGYGGGAMTRALRSQTIVISLLRAWNVEMGSGPQDEFFSIKTLQKESTGLHCSSFRHSASSSRFVSQPENGQPLASALSKSGVTDGAENCPSFSKTKVHNSITMGLVDLATKQWVHMVCGLWTSETRCPNVDTMSAFDVSGVPLPGDDVVCCMCKRAGGSCMRCRVENCHVRFHPWCAHLKGLLQTEVEGVDYENVGFYGRCEHHATHPIYESEYTINTGGSCLDEKKLACARTEGYKGHKRDGFRHNYCDQRKGSDSCVPQEQLNAWAYINGQKPCTQELPKLAISEIEHDTRKEYLRYKQAKLWKHLVVYKSGIHALGLYTSRFISRDEMVVEYVGEIVGQRVSDKRENEYQSAKKLQYKSACYFFRIDKEHIIDATCKGGIGRFVNHSCSPNCVAKVISVRNEKKVIFLAERDIFPGEEITYDYHFNHEDEGKKIPCYCNSKNCRRYLN